MNQPALFHDSILDAIGAAVASCGGFKKVAAKLYGDGLDITTATTRLRNSLNPEHLQKLCPQELLSLARIAREQGDHSIMQYLAQELGYSVTPIDPETERDKLQREFIESVKRCEQLARRLERTNVRSVA